MTPYEWLFRCLLQLEHPLYQQVHAALRAAVNQRDGHARVLDVGGRTSNYTIGVDADIYITELPRESPIQKSLNLGANSPLIDRVRRRRSNIKEYIFDDMTKTTLSQKTFDIATAIEVIEHVDQDDLFVNNLRSVLRDDGIAILSTPNGDFVPNTNPDHIRHYTKDGLEVLLRKYFAQVDIGYAVVYDKYFEMGMNKWSLRHPARTFTSFVGNLINSRTHPYNAVRDQSIGTLHLFVVAYCKRQQ
jgi:SAM-dependent methyltransferase